MSSMVPLAAALDLTGDEGEPVLLLLPVPRVLTLKRVSMRPKGRATIPDGAPPPGESGPNSCPVTVPCPALPRRWWDRGN